MPIIKNEAWQRDHYKDLRGISMKFRICVATWRITTKSNRTEKICRLKRMNRFYPHIRTVLFGSDIFNLWRNSYTKIFSTKFYVEMSSFLKSLLFQAKEHVIKKAFFLDSLLIFGVEIKRFCKDLCDREEL